MAKKKHKKDSDADLPVIMDYGIGCISIYDPVDMMPYNDPPVTEQTRFKKLRKEMKAEFKWLASSITIEYWKENRQIPFGEEMSKLRIRLLRIFAEEYSILLDILKENGAQTTLAQRQMFATRAFGVSSHYDTAIHSWFSSQK